MAENKLHQANTDFFAIGIAFMIMNAFILPQYFAIKKDLKHYSEYYTLECEQEFCMALSAHRVDPKRTADFFLTDDDCKNIQDSIANWQLKVTVFHFFFTLQALFLAFLGLQSLYYLMRGFLQYDPKLITINGFMQSSATPYSENAYRNLSSKLDSLAENEANALHCPITQALPKAPVKVSYRYTTYTSRHYSFICDHNELQAWWLRGADKTDFTRSINLASPLVTDLCIEDVRVELAANIDAAISKANLANPTPFASNRATQAPAASDTGLRHRQI